MQWTQLRGSHVLTFISYSSSTKINHLQNVKHNSFLNELGIQNDKNEIRLQLKVMLMMIYAICKGFSGGKLQSATFHAHLISKS